MNTNAAISNESAGSNYDPIQNGGAYLATDSVNDMYHKCMWSNSGGTCSQEFRNLKGLVKHLIEFHVRGRENTDHTCYWEQCNRNGKTFKHKYRLVNHLREHTGERPFICSFRNCNEAFARPENRKIHERTHTGEKPFGCNYCEKRFANSSDRVKHHKRHSNPQPFYSCKVVGCQKMYWDQSSVRHHMRTKHGKNPTPKCQKKKQLYKDTTNMLPTKRLKPNNPELVNNSNICPIGNGYPAEISLNDQGSYGRNHNNSDELLPLTSNQHPRAAATKDKMACPPSSNQNYVTIPQPNPFYRSNSNQVWTAQNVQYLLFVVLYELWLLL